jgi:hypothetical protein
VAESELLSEVLLVPVTVGEDVIVDTSVADAVEETERDIVIVADCVAVGVREELADGELLLDSVSVMLTDEVTVKDAVAVTMAL